MALDNSNPLFSMSQWVFHISESSQAALILYLPHVRESKTVLDSGFHTLDSGFQVLDSSLLSAELGFWIPIVSGISDSLSCIPDSKTQNSGFLELYSGFQNPGCRIPHFTSKNFLDSESVFPYQGRLYDFLSFVRLNPAIKLLTFDERFWAFWQYPCSNLRNINAQWHYRPLPHNSFDDGFQVNRSSHDSHFAIGLDVLTTYCWLSSNGVDRDLLYYCK